jgi:predicted AlkP superfamily pyrophosphatase or phosphodiesterase
MATAAVSWPVSVGMPADDLVPEFWRSGSNHPSDLSLIRALSTPGLIEGAESARQRPLRWPLTDADRTDLAVHLLRERRPRLLLLHLVELDGAAHTEGPNSAAAMATLTRMDAHVRQIREALARSVTGDRAHLVIVSDHGFAPTEHQLQPNALFVQHGLITPADDGRIREWQAYYHAEGGGGFVHLANPSDAALAGRVRRLLETLQSDPRNGVASIWSREDLDRFGADPRASFGLGMRPGFYSGSGHDAVLVRARNRGGHGFDPDLPELHASLVLSGPSVRGRGSLGIVRMTQVAPTVARLLGVELDPRADAPLR